MEAKWPNFPPYRPRCWILHIQNCIPDSQDIEIKAWGLSRHRLPIVQNKRVPELSNLADIRQRVLIRWSSGQSNGPCELPVQVAFTATTGPRNVSGQAPIPPPLPEACQVG